MLYLEKTSIICSIASYIANVWNRAIIHNYHLQFQWHGILLVAGEEGIFLAHHNVVPNVDKVKYMSIALHHIQHCQSNNTKAK